MKAYWHTKTLFIQWWKYKWACKYDHCINCLKCDKKHKWRWLCTSCWDKERDKNPKRKEIKHKAWMKWHVINKPKKPREEWKKMWPKPTWFDQIQYKKDWYRMNREPILLLRKWESRKKKWLPCIEYRAPKRTVYLPFDDLIKNYKQFEMIKSYLWA